MGLNLTTHRAQSLQNILLDVPSTLCHDLVHDLSHNLISNMVVKLSQLFYFFQLSSTFFSTECRKLFPTYIDMQVVKGKVRPTNDRVNVDNTHVMCASASGFRLHDPEVSTGIPLIAH